MVNKNEKKTTVKVPIDSAWNSPISVWDISMEYTTELKEKIKKTQAKLKDEEYVDPKKMEFEVTFYNDGKSIGISMAQPQNEDKKNIKASDIIEKLNKD